MKRIGLLCFFPLMLLSVSCKKNVLDVGPYFRYVYQEHFIDRYYAGGFKLLPHGSDGTCTSLSIGAADAGKFITDWEKPSEYERQAELHEDYFNRWVYRSRGWYVTVFAEQFQSLHVISNADWDEEHPAGTPLDDLLRVQFTSIGAFVRGGYHAGGADESEFMDEWHYATKVDKLVSELTPADLDMIEYDYVKLYFMRAPTLAREHMLTVTFTTTEGKVWRSSIHCEPQVDPKN